MRRNFIWVMLFLIFNGMLISFPGISYGDIIVIGNRSVPEAELSSREIKKIYLGKKNLWSNGYKIIFVMLKKGDITKRFLKNYLKKNPDIFDKYWKKKIFHGSKSLPTVFEREKDLVEYVAKTRGAIGYISSESYSDYVKILSVLH